MNNMEKAVAYDKAIELAQRYKESNVVEDMYIDSMFPELAESEDERIIGWLMNLVKGHIEWLKDRIDEQLSNGQIYGGELDKAKIALSWLERQGEKNIPDDAVVDPNENGLIADTIRQGEHKLLDDIIVFVSGYACKSVVNKWTGFLKSLKDKCFPQQAEWSEEDEGILIEAVSILENYSHFILANKLKSLRPQKKWKPSEEQIRVVARLRHCLLEDVRGNDIVILDNLLEQLKAL